MTPRAGSSARNRNRRPSGIRPLALVPALPFLLPFALPALAAAAVGAPAVGASAVGAPAPGVRGGAAQETRDIRLLGLMRQGDRSVALLQFGPRRPTRLLVGETGRGWTLVAVEADRVRLESASGRTVEIPLPEPAEVPPASATDEIEPPTAPPEAPEAAPAVTEAREEEPLVHAPPNPAGADPAPTAARASSSGAATGGERRFSRDEVRLRLATELPRILTGATVLPRILGDEVVGLELVSFPTDTILGETGLQPNDVLLRVNDREVRGVESLAILAQRFQTASRLELAVERNGEVVSLRYTIE